MNSVLRIPLDASPEQVTRLQALQSGFAQVCNALAPLVQQTRVWNRVALHHHVPCLDCHACRHRAFAQCPQYKRTGVTAGFEPAGGGYAEYVRVLPFVLPGVVKIPRGNSFLEGAMLEPVNTVLKAVRRLALLPDDTVLVAGQGPIGLMFTRLLALEGIRVLATDLLDSRLKLARQFGARWSFPASGPGNGVQEIPASRRSKGLIKSDSSGHSAAAKSLAELVEKVTHRCGLDAAVMAVPSTAALAQAQELVRGGGQVLLFSNTRRGDKSALDLATICVDEKDLLGSYSADFLLQPAVARLVFSRKLDVRRLITHQFPLEQTAAAIERAATPGPESLKIVVSQ